MVQQLSNGVLDFESNPDVAIQFLMSRNLFDQLSEMSDIELKNFFDSNFVLFDQDTPKHEIAELTIDMLDAVHFQILMAKNSARTVYEMLVEEGFVNVIDDITALSIEYPTK